MKRLKHTAFLLLKFLWTIWPLKRLTAQIIRANPNFLEKMYKDLRFEGTFSVNGEGFSFNLFNPGYTTIENELFWKGLQGWEKVSVGLWIELARKSDVILDIGANSGLYSLIASSVNPVAKIHAFEPVQRTTELLKRNLELNSPNEIEFHQVAVSNYTGKAIFFDLDTKSQYSASLNKEMLSRFENRIEYEVDVIRLDEFPSLDNLKIDLIKLDVEMHEPEAIEGMIEIIKRDRPSFLIEILTPEIGEKVSQLLNGLGYLVFSIDEKSPPRLLKTIQQSEFHNLLLIQEDELSQLNLKI